MPDRNRGGVGAVAHHDTHCEKDRGVWLQAADKAQQGDDTDPGVWLQGVDKAQQGDDKAPGGWLKGVDRDPGD